MGAMEPGPAWTNREIAEWAARQLLAIRDEAPRPRLPRTDSRKLGDPAAWKEIGTLQMELIEQSLDAARRAQEPCKQVFLSYRTRDFEQVERLAADRTSGALPDSTPRRAAILLPGELVYERELLTPMRRWQVLGLIEDQIRAAAELWVYPSDRYADSWWTQGELICSAYKPTGTGPEVKIYNPASRQARDAGEAYRPALSDGQSAAITRLLTNTRATGLGPETTSRMRMLRLLYRLGLGKLVAAQARRFFSHAEPMLKAALGSIPESDSWIEDMKEMFEDPRLARQYVRSTVFDHDFWDTLGIPAFDHHGPAEEINVARFLDSGGWRQVRLSPRKLRAAARKGKVLSLGGEGVSISEQPPRVLWHGTRMGGRFPGRLESLPTFVTVPAG
jgi:hypothetical protein